MKKILFIFLISTVLAAVAATANAGNYILKRVIVTWSDSSTDDSAQGHFQADGSMSLNGNIAAFNVSLCYDGSCEQINGNSTILSVNHNNTKVTLKNNNDGSIEDLTVISLSPNLIIMTTYDDGTIEMEEWEPVNPFAKRAKKEAMDNDPVVTGTTNTGAGKGGGFGIAKWLRP